MSEILGENMKIGHEGIMLWEKKMWNSEKKKV